MERNVIHTGDAFDVLEDLDDESVHAVICDPPYGLAFMGRDWDDFEPKEYQEWCEVWASRALDVLKPGGHLLAFSGNRTHHRLFTGVEDAGFEIRDTLTWHYGSGFPKASDVSKTIDKRSGKYEDREEVGTYVRPDGEDRNYSEWVGGAKHMSVGLDEPNRDMEQSTTITAPATDAAKKWDGWKTGLKPATEFVVMARKPFDGATVDCVLEHGTGALNIDGCRIGTDEEWADEGDAVGDEVVNALGKRLNNSGRSGSHDEGRYPSNVAFDETAAAQLDADVGELEAGAHTTVGESESVNTYSDKKYTDAPDTRTETDTGGPSRYFYTSKASRSERTENGAIENDHPTVKPGDLMEWLIRLVTREGQTVLDPFAGSGTTCKAAKALGREFVGIERQAKWADVARVRCGLTPNDPSVVRDDDGQHGLEAYADGGEP